MDASPGTKRLTSLARRLGLDRNLLRRRIDRAETWVMAGLLAAFVIGAPLAAFAAGNYEHAAGLQIQRSQQTWHLVPAILLQNASGASSYVYESSAVAWVRAHWTAPDGSPRAGEVPVAAGVRAGSTVRVWVDRSGRVMGVRLTSAQIIDRVIAASAFTLFVLAALLLGVAVLAHWLFERSRLIEWEAAWASTEPQWTRRA